MENLQDLFTTLEAMGFSCKDSMPLTTSAVYRTLKDMLEKSMNKKIPKKLSKRYGLNGDFEDLMTADELQERMAVLKYEKEVRPPRSTDIWDDMVYEVSSMFIETDDNQNDPGIVVQKCLKGVNKYDRERFMELVGNMTFTEFKGFCIHITFLQKFAYVNSGRWVTDDEPHEDDMEYFTNLKYPFGDDYKREYGTLKAVLSDKDAEYLVNNARIFLRAQAGYDPSEPITASTDISSYSLQYGTDAFEPGAVAGYGYTIEETFKDFMNHWYRNKILKQ